VPCVDRADFLELGEIRHADLGEIARSRRTQILQFGNGTLLHTAQLGGGA
jgi:hypothetical protein